MILRGMLIVLIIVSILMCVAWLTGINDKGNRNFLCFMLSKDILITVVLFNIYAYMYW